MDMGTLVDKSGANGLIGAMIRAALAPIFCLLFAAPASAIVGGADVLNGGPAQHVVMIISTRGSLCTATALARDLVLTAGHCVAPQASYRVLLADKKPPGLEIKSIAIHPRYNPKDYASGRVTADVALVKLATPLPADVRPARLAIPAPVTAGDRFLVAGYGTTTYGTENGIGLPRAASLIATGRPGTLQIRLVDPQGRGERAGLGGCTADSGGPAFIEKDGQLAVIGVISWSTGPKLSEGCGGMTGITPLALYRSWIVETAAKLGSQLAP
jgi:secreted trypsin-like serine protease